MANYRSIHVKIWSDPVIENLPANARYVFIYLITCPARNESALYDITWKRIAQDTGLSVRQVGKAVKVLVETRRIMYDEETATVWVINAVKHQALNDNCRKSIFTDLERCSSSSLATAFASFYPDFKGYQTHTNGLANPPIGIGYRVQGIGDRVQGEVKDEKPIEEVKALIAGTENVLMSTIEYSSLITRLGSEKRAKAAIEILDNAKGAKGYKYKSDYRAILNWVIPELEKRESSGKVKPVKERIERKPECEHCGGEHRSYACPNLPITAGGQAAKEAIAAIKEMTKGMKA